MLHTTSRLLTPLLLSIPLLLQAAEQPGPVPPAEATSHFQLPEGFKATLFAGEPDIVQPIAMTFDDRGRLWVVECLSYPKWEETGHDRVVILEDTDGDGRFDSKKVFLDDGANLSGIELGFGGVWLTAVPNLLFVPDANGDDKPDGKPQVLLDGWDMKAKHNVVNGLVWGPDGWLYGCNGILSNSLVGPPGTPAAQRTPINCGIWRYHPQQKKFEVFANGTTNPWGLAFDARGEAFLTNCVIEHVFHVASGGNYRRMFGLGFNSNHYQLMQTCADHIHWAGGDWQSSRGGVGKHGELGGGHAHSGAAIYLGDNWPDDYRGNLLTCNIHGNRVNRDTMARKGSGYVASHAPDFLMAHDSWFRGLVVKYGPDGGVYVLDWSDTGECHDYEDIHRENGRMYKVTFGPSRPWREDLAKLSDADLIARLSHRNHWHRDHARRLLQERAAAGKLGLKTIEQLQDVLANSADSSVQLQALWALHVVGGLKDAQRFALLAHPDDTQRGWLVRLEAEAGLLDPAVLKTFEQLARKDKSPHVRLQLASILQRLESESRWPIALELVAHGEDASDANLPLMIWYGIEPLVGSGEDEQIVELVEATAIPLVRQFIARRLAVESPPRLAPVLQLLEKSQSADVQFDLLVGMQAALEGRRDLPMPAKWPAVYKQLSRSKDARVAERATFVALLLGDENAFADLRRTALDKSLSAPVRDHALAMLVGTHRPEIGPLCLASLDDPALRSAAIRGLASFDQGETAAELIERYTSLSQRDRLLAIATLIARPQTASALVDAVAGGKVSRSDVSEYDRRQLAEIRDPVLQKKIKQVLTVVQPTSQERAELIAKMKQLVLAGDPQQASSARGRIVFEKNCATCHTLFGKGRQVGPDLTGSQRANLDYVLINVLDPGALVGSDYQITQVVTTDGRIIGGIVKADDANTLTLETATERVVLAKDEIEQQKKSRTSMMPDGLLLRLSDQEVRDLVRYLSSESQVPLP
jgi:putative membrane-bound dehydrogenase-like protein